MGFAVGSDGGIEMSESLSPSSPIRSVDRSLRLEARHVDTSPRLPFGQRALRFSCLPPRRLTWGASRMFRPLFHPNMRSLWRLSLVLWPNKKSIGWPSIMLNCREASWTNAFCGLKLHLYIRACCSSRPFSARLFVPSSDYYGNVMGTSEHG